MKKQVPAPVRTVLILLIIFGLNPFQLFSQEAGSCAEKLKTAQNLFERGQIEQVPAILRECMRSGFNREESLSAYKLLIQAYLFNDNIALADSAMLDFLKKNPEYELSPTDHSSFVRLLNSYNVKPVIQISLHMGTNLPFVTFVNRNPKLGEPGESKYSTNALNFYSSLEAKFELNKKFEVNIEAGFSQLSITNSETMGEYSELTYTETQHRIEIPASVTYNYKNINRLTLYGRLGFGPALNLGATSKSSELSIDLNNQFLKSGSEIDLRDSRISMDLFAQVGGGIKYKTRGGFFMFEVRSNFGLYNQNIGGDTTQDDELNWYYHHGADDFHLNALNFTVGYTRIFYKPSKRED